jgi:hypothetical protein
MPLLCWHGRLPAVSLMSWVSIDSPQEIGPRYHSHAQIDDLKERIRF